MVVEICIIYYIKINYMFRSFSLAIFRLIIEKIEHVVDLCVINYTYLYHHIIVLDKYTQSNLVYYKHNGDDELYD